MGFYFPCFPAKKKKDHHSKSDSKSGSNGSDSGSKS
jgi:hypothetical protein